MLLNKKNKCPVCNNKTLSLWDKFGLGNKGSIMCHPCNSRLEYTKSTFLKAYLPFAVSLMAAIFFESKVTQHIILLIGAVFMIAYYVFFGELEEYIEEEPAYNFNEFLDNLRLQNSKK